MGVGHILNNKKNKNFKIGLIGFNYGWVKLELCRMAGIEVGGVSDIDEHKLYIAKQNNIPIFKDYKELLKKRDIGAVYISTPNYLHAEQVITALKSGKHVLCEKPMATTIRDCNRMIKTSEETGKILQIGLQYRHSNFFNTMETIIKDKKVGDIKMMWCKEFRSPFYPGTNNWRLQQKLSGGSLVEKNCHHFDIFNWMINSKAVKVSAFGGKDVYNKGDVIDNAWVMVEYKNGVRALLGLCLFLENYDELEIGVISTNGKVEAYLQIRPQEEKISISKYAEYEKQYIYVLNCKQKYRAKIKVTPATKKQGHLGSLNQMKSFIDSIRSNKPAKINGLIGRESVLVALAAEKSIKENRIVEIAELDNSDI